MITIASGNELRERLRAERAAGKRIGFVPTMGFLHDGHLSLVARALELTDLVVASIFVNPTQFAPGEDLTTYPRDPEGDERKLREAGCAYLYMPQVDEMYPPGFATHVAVDGVTGVYEGASRPTHFKGVTTVVSKLFNIVTPDVALFGQKDAQQVAVVRRMIRDLNFGIELVVGETVREEGGLAMSSRNVRLSADDREHALTISRALFEARDAVAAGADPRRAEEVMRSVLSPAIELDYADVIDPDTFERAESAEGPLLGIIAGRVGKTRLIDNLPLAVPAVQGSERGEGVVAGQAAG